MHEIAFTIVGRFILKPLSMEHSFNGGRLSGLMLLSKPLHGEGERGGSPHFRQSGQSCLSCVFFLGGGKHNVLSSTNEGN